MCLVFLVIFFGEKLFALCFKERNKWHGVGRVGRWGGPGRTWERGKHDHNVLSEKKFS